MTARSFSTTSKRRYWTRSSANYASIIAYRRALVARYQAQLGDLPQLQLPPAPDSDPDDFDVFQNYEIQAHDWDALRTHLTACGVGTLLQSGGKAIHQFSALGLNVSLPNTERLFRHCLICSP